MKRFTAVLALLTIFLFSFFLVGFFGFGAAAAPTDAQDLHVSLIVPPVIRNAVSFPIVAEITNTKADGKILLQKASWRWGQKMSNGYVEYSEDLADELEPTGDARKIVNELRSKKGTLNPAEIDTLKLQHEKLKERNLLSPLQHHPGDGRGAQSQRLHKACSEFGGPGSGHPEGTQ
ncbi:MAG: hypothetical protein M1379_18090 [Firmicutes bacterium]|nr:hypothetical protein [Bacillota bacterium]